MCMRVYENIVYKYKWLLINYVFVIGGGVKILLITIFLIFSCFISEVIQNIKIHENLKCFFYIWKE